MLVQVAEIKLPLYEVCQNTTQGEAQRGARHLTDATATPSAGTAEQKQGHGAEHISPEPQSSSYSLRTWADAGMLGVTVEHHLSRRASRLEEGGSRVPVGQWEERASR